MNSYVYNKSMSDYCTKIAQAYMGKDTDLAVFYANAAKGFEARSLEVTLAECENEERIASLINE